MVKYFGICLFVILSMIPTNHISANQEIAKIIDTPWVKSSQLKKLIQPMKDDRYLPYQISGKYEDGGIFYKGSYIPYPTNVEHYKYYWGMNEEWYTKRSDLYKSIGFEEVWHQVFKDSVGTDIHQAIWFLYKKQKDKEKGAIFNKTINRMEQI